MLFAEPTGPICTCKNLPVIDLDNVCFTVVSFIVTTVSDCAVPFETVPLSVRPPN